MKLDGISKIENNRRGFSMKKYSIQMLVAGTTLLSASLFAQTTNVQSYTNADLTPSTTTTPQSSIPGLTTGANTPAAPAKYPPLTADQIQQFNEQMLAQIQLAEQRVQNLMSKVQDNTRMPMSIDKVELEGAIIDLDVKKTLVSKFQGSPSLKSPKVRQALMQILSKDYIQEADLALLQAIVDAERPLTYP